jgi:hypothetical protein
MPNGYPCPSCGDANAALFIRDTSHFNEAYVDTHAAASAPYACEACLAAAGVKSAGAVVMNAGVTSTNHPEA